MVRHRVRLRSRRYPWKLKAHAENLAKAIEETSDPEPYARRPDDRRSGSSVVEGLSMAVQKETS